MNSYKKNSKSPEDVVSLQKGFPKKPETITPSQLANSAERLVEFEMSYQRKQFESYTTMIANLLSLKGSGVLKFKSEQEQGLSGGITNVVSLRPVAEKKPKQGG